MRSCIHTKTCLSYTAVWTLLPCPSGPAGSGWILGEVSSLRWCWGTEKAPRGCQSSSSSIWTQLPGMYRGDCWGVCAALGAELMILVDPFQMRIFHDSKITLPSKNNITPCSLSQSRVPARTPSHLCMCFTQLQLD